MQPREFARWPDGLHRCIWADGRAAVLKIRRGRSDDFFHAEARGLATLAQTHTLRVPQRFGVWNEAIALEDLGVGAAQPADWQRAGRELARLHRVAGPRFGFHTRGWCGDSAQDNSWDLDGCRFFAERRLLPQARRAFDAGRLSSDDVGRVESIAARLSHWFPPAPPVLCHGDLWLGNLHVCAGGELALIDGGAVHYGWAECDLAMLTLFGEPPPFFFAGYAAEAGVDAQWRERAPVLNLYHLLNHLNLFGASYLSPVRAVLARYGS